MALTMEQLGRVKTDDVYQYLPGWQELRDRETAGLR